MLQKSSYEFFPKIDKDTSGLHHDLCNLPRGIGLSIGYLGGQAFVRVSLSIVTNLISTARSCVGGKCAWKVEVDSHDC